MSTNNPGPIDELRDGALKASLWYKSGDNGPFITVSLARTYTDSQGRVADSNSLVGTDLLRAAHLLTRAYDRSAVLIREFRNTPDQPDLLEDDQPVANGNRSQAGRDFDRGSRRQGQRAASPR